MTGTVCDSPKPRRWSHQILAAEPGRDRDPLDPCPLGHQAALSRHPSRAPCSEQGWLVSWGLSRIGHRTPGATSASIANPPRDQEPVRPCPQASVSPAVKWEVGLSQWFPKLLSRNAAPRTPVHRERMCPEQVPRLHTAGSAGALPGPAPLAGLPAVWPGARPAFTPQFPFCKAGTQQDPWLCLGLNELISLRVVGKNARRR